jgi:hypothetical protein
MEVAVDFNWIGTKEYMVYTTKTIDYAVDSFLDIHQHTWVHLVNYGQNANAGRCPGQYGGRHILCITRFPST